ncbi:hypothetical protein MHYP_G00029980 [Metynnis hypsauchen]
MAQRHGDGGTRFCHRSCRGPLASVTGEEPKSLKEAFKVPAIDGRHVPQSIYLHSSFSQCLSTATKRTPALLLRLVHHEWRSCCPFP